MPKTGKQTFAEGVISTGFLSIINLKYKNSNLLKS
jgi:hypothetical protein